jgi:hypothetical protein
MKLAEHTFDPEARAAVCGALDVLGQYAIGVDISAENVLNSHGSALSPQERQLFEMLLVDLRRHAVAAGMLRFRIGERTKEITESN